MRKTILLAILSILSMSTIGLATGIYAQTTLDLGSGLAGSDVNCINDTSDGLNYCFLSAYVTSGTPAGKVVRFSSDLSNYTICDTGSYRNYQGIIPMNKTWFWQVANTGGRGLFSFDTCAFNRTIGDVSGNTWGGDVYINGATRWLYWGNVSNKAWNEEGSAETVLLSSLTPYIRDFAIPITNDNSTIYAQQDGASSDNSIIYTITNGVKDSLLLSICAEYDICEPTLTVQAFDIINEGSVKWLYFIVDSGSSVTLYKTNLTATIDDITTNVVVEYPINSTVAITDTLTLSVNLITNKNGTLYWFFDGSLLGNTSIDNAPVDAIYTWSVSGVGLGNHSWYAQFNATAGGYSWSTPLTYFTTVSAQNPVTSSESFIISALGPFGPFIMAIAISLAISFLALSQDKKNSGWGIKAFTVCLIVLLAMFAYITWIPAWFIIVIIVLAGLAIFFKVQGG